MGAVVGAFPADIGERYIHFVFEFCDTRTWYIMLFLLLWLLGGLSALIYCLLSSTGAYLPYLESQKSLYIHKCLFVSLSVHHENPSTV